MSWSGPDTSPWPGCSVKKAFVHAIYDLDKQAWLITRKVTVAWNSAKALVSLGISN